MVARALMDEVQLAQEVQNGLRNSGLLTSVDAFRHPESAVLTLRTRYQTLSGEQKFIAISLSEQVLCFQRSVDDIVKHVIEALRTRIYQDTVSISAAQVIREIHESPVNKWERRIIL